MTRNEDSGAPNECIAGLTEERTASASIPDARCTVHSSCPYILRTWYKKECTEGVQITSRLHCVDGAPNRKICHVARVVHTYDGLPAFARLHGASAYLFELPHTSTGGRHVEFQNCHVDVYQKMVPTT